MKLSVSPDLAAGRIKPMNAVNNGPFYTENGDQNAAEKCRNKNLKFFHIPNLSRPYFTDSETIVT